MFKNIQVIHLPQLGPDILHGHLEPRVAVYRIVYGQNVYVTVDADGSSAHYRAEEGDFAFRGIEEISCIGHRRPCRVAWRYMDEEEMGLGWISDPQWWRTPRRQTQVSRLLTSAFGSREFKRARNHLSHKLL